ncbi:MAG: FtsX-like permease family protein [Acidobacteria bacterium]|nr:FtsX-like permease family protein [Acidobacteriota bacterium]
MAEPAIFRALLALYPPRFRREYGQAVLDAMHGRWRELYAEGPRRLRLLTILFRDVVFSLPRAWWTHGLGRQGRLVRLPEGSRLMSTLASDIRYAVRRLIRTPGTAAIAVIAIALGIGLTATMFSIVNGTIIQGLPFEEPHELMVMWRYHEDEPSGRLVGRYADYEDILERETTFEGIAAIDMGAAFNVSPPGSDPELVQGAYVTANMFTVLGESPFLGAYFDKSAEEVGAPKVSMIGHQFWRERLEADPSAVGRTIRINGVESQIVGVMPEGFGFPFNQQVWQPLQFEPVANRGESPALMFLGRLDDGVSVPQGQADIHRIMAQLGKEFPDSNEGMAMLSQPYITEVLPAQIPAMLYTMLAAVSMVLIIACANVANLLLARASQRTREVAISSALGARRSRVFFQLLSEAAIIAAVGATLGLGIAKFGADQFNAALAAFPGGPPFWFTIGLDPTVVGFVVLLTIGACMFSGVIPAFKASGTNPNDVLKDSTRGGSSMQIGRLSRMLVMVEVAASCALLIAAGLMVKSVTNSLTQEYAFETGGLFLTGLALPADTYPDAESRRQFYNELGPVLRAIPGVTKASIATDPPVVGFTNGRFEIEGNIYQVDSDYPSARVVTVDEEYFGTLGASMVSGRDFTSADTADSEPVAIVDQNWADLYFRGESPIGRRIAIRGLSQVGTSDRNDSMFFTIVGLAPSLYLESPFVGLAAEAIYVPIQQRPTTGLLLIAKVDGDDPLEITRSVKDAIARVDPDLPIANSNSMDGSLAQSNAFLNIFAALFAVFGAAALFLATIGLYGVLSFSVAQRKQEVGLRMALGATPRHVWRLIIGQGFRQMAVGLGIGLGLAVLLANGLAPFFVDVSPTDPVVIGSILLVLSLAGLAACYFPARRAVRVDPLDAMRAE